MKTAYTIDATGMTIGRIASKAAALLVGKSVIGSKKHLVPEVTVSIQNARKTKIEEKKLSQKIYVTYSGYPAGIKRQSLEKKIAKHGTSDALKEAVWGMLPKNKLRARMIKNLVISE